jgi:hypothetical protein
MSNESDSYNCAVSVSIAYLGVPRYFLGGFTALPGSSAAFVPYPIVIEHPGGANYDLTIDISRKDTTKSCSATAVVQLVPES